MSEEMNETKVEELVEPMGEIEESTSVEEQQDVLSEETKEEVVEETESIEETQEASNEPQEDALDVETKEEAVEEIKEETESTEEPQETSEEQQEANGEEKDESKPEEGQGKAILEGLLFIVGDDGISLEQASSALGIDEEKTAVLFDELMQDYLNDHHGIEIANYGGTYRFLSKAFVHPYAKTLFQINKQATLSQAALETLAIIAYKQPITRVEIEEIRGVGADMMLRKLLARDLIKESGRSEAAGRPILYEVTEEFMNSFKLLSLNELPDLPQFDNEEEEGNSLFDHVEGSKE